MSSSSEIEEVSFPATGGRPMRGWLSLPVGEAGPRPAVVVIHEAVGLAPNIKPVLRRFSANGYVALAPNLFDKPAPKALCVARTMLTMVQGRGEAIEDLNGAVRFLKAHEAVDPKRLAVAGFCMGGGFALLLALGGEVKASAPYYGMSPPYLEQVTRSCPVVASYGGRDRLMAPQAPRLKGRLERAGIAHDVKTYPDAGHSYMTEELPGLAYRIGKLGPLQIGYRPEEAEDSWRRMLAFFGEHV